MLARPQDRKVVTLADLYAPTASGAGEATASSRPEISSAPLVAEQRTAPEVAARVGVLTRQVAAEASIIEKQERESSRKALAEARRRGAASQIAAAQGPTLPAGPARARMVWQPSRVAQREPAKIVSLSEAVGGGPAKPRPRATATGAWGQPALAPVEAAPEVVQPGLGEGMPPVAVNSELCFGPELSDEELNDAIAKVVDELRDDMHPETRAAEVVHMPPAAGPEARVRAACRALTECGEWDARPASAVGPFIVSLLEQRAFSAGALRTALKEDVYPLLHDLALDAPNLWKVVGAALTPLVERRALRCADLTSPDIEAMPPRLRKAMGLDPETMMAKEAEAKAARQAAEAKAEQARKEAAAAAAAASKGPEEDDDDDTPAAGPTPSGAPAARAPVAAAPARYAAPSGSGYIPPHLRHAGLEMGGMSRPSVSDADVASLLSSSSRKSKSKKAEAAPAVASTSDEAVAALLASDGKKKKKKAKKAKKDGEA
ncbi:hypothetical protein FNF27_02057 [Cafeteria roenbergensis]|uniref:Uncharacterized protein n=1 Tax=Cafeteria roenbergensis TaxID=33653 RepID=A0A5A8EKP4_CAFRO|nr:hypothetical protein FNF27_02057 [Cafeteria roenbergensis]